jgi:hypothetical protein
VRIAKTSNRLKSTAKKRDGRSWDTRVSHDFPEFFSLPILVGSYADECEAAGKR